MGLKANLESPLLDKHIAVPESRQLDVLADLFERRGARVLRVPLVAILDAPEQDPVLQWLRSIAVSPPDYLIILTGEGVRRLHGAAKRAGIEQDFVQALAACSKVCRGPKPGRALKELGLKADLLGTIPTTAGIIETLSGLELENKRVAVQLYGEEPNPLLMDYLASRKLAECLVVAPYVYASDSDAASVVQLIRAMATGQIDLIAFTSQPQVKRLFEVANKQSLLMDLQAGMSRTRVAAIGPVVADMLRDYDCRVDVMPQKSYFMKPLVTAAENLFKEIA